MHCCGCHPRCDGCDLSRLRPVTAASVFTPALKRVPEARQSLFSEILILNARFPPFTVENEGQTVHHHLTPSSPPWWSALKPRPPSLGSCQLFQRQLPPSGRVTSCSFSPKVIFGTVPWDCALLPRSVIFVRGKLQNVLSSTVFFITHSPEFRSATITCHLKVGQFVLHLPPVGSRMRAGPILSAKEEELESTPRLGSSSRKLAAEESLQSATIRWPHTHTYLKAVPGVLVPFGELSPQRLRIIKHWVLGLH